MNLMECLPRTRNYLAGNGRAVCLWTDKHVCAGGGSFVSVNEVYVGSVGRPGGDQAMLSKWFVTIASTSANALTAQLVEQNFSKVWSRIRLSVGWPTNLFFVQLPQEFLKTNVTVCISYSGIMVLI